MSESPDAQSALNDLWEEHLKHEFETKDTSATLETMIGEAYVNHVPTMTGGSGKEELREFYSTHFIPHMPDDHEIIPVSRTIGSDRIVDELVFRFTHSVAMNWLLPGVRPTGRAVEFGLVVIAEFQDGKLACERIYWDQASVLVQLGLIDSTGLPVVGAAAARKILDPSMPSNELIGRGQKPG